MFNNLYQFTNQFSSVAQSYLALCDPMDFSMPGFLVLQHLLQFAQTHVRGVCDAIQPSHPLSSPSPPAFNLSQHQSLFQWISSSHQWSNKSIGASASALVLPMYSGLISFRIDWLISLQFKALLKVFSSTTVQKHQFFSAQDSFSHDFWKNYSFN